MRVVQDSPNPTTEPTPSPWPFLALKPTASRTGKETWVGRLSKETLGQPLERLGLSTRPGRCLRRLASVGELLNQQEVDLAAYRGFGQGCLLEVRQRLAQFVLDHLRLLETSTGPGAEVWDVSAHFAAWSGPPQPRPLGNLLDEFIELVIRSSAATAAEAVRRPRSPLPALHGGHTHECPLEQLAATLFEGMPDRHRQLLELRFSGSTAHPPTLAELGRSVGLTRERVRQILNGTLARFAHDAEVRRRRGFTEFLEQVFGSHGALMWERELLPPFLSRYPGTEARAATVLRIVLATTRSFARVEGELWCARPWHEDSARLALDRVHAVIRNQGRWMSPAQVTARSRKVAPVAGGEEAMIAACLRTHPRLHTPDGCRFGLREWEWGLPTSLQEKLICCLRADNTPRNALQLTRRLAGILPDGQAPDSAEVLAALATGEPFHPAGRGFYTLRDGNPG